MASSALPNSGARMDLGKLACAVILIAAVPTLTSCAKNHELTQDIKLSGSDKKVTVTRKETFEPKLFKLDFKRTYARSELSVVGSDLPVWKQRLQPIYFGELPDGGGYVLVAVVPDAIGCAERGKPASPYAAFAAVKERWHEIPVPKSLDGQSANLALIVEDFASVNDAVMKKIDLSAASGC